jgi:hypothetical protein
MWTAWYVSTQNKEIVIVYFWGVTLHDPWSILDLHFKAPHPQIVLWMHSLLRISFSNDFMLVSLNFLALLSERELKKSPVAALEGHHLLERCTHHVYVGQCILYSGNPSYTSSVLPTNEMWESLQVYHPMSTVTACMIWVLLFLKSVVPWILLFFIYFRTSWIYLSCTSCALITYQNSELYFHLCCLFQYHLHVQTIHKSVEQDTNVWAIDASLLHQLTQI